MNKHRHLPEPCGACTECGFYCYPDDASADVADGAACAWCDDFERRQGVHVPHDPSQSLAKPN